MKKIASFQIDEATLKELDEAAQKLGVTRSAVIRVLVLEAITGKVPIPEINKAKEVTPQP